MMSQSNQLLHAKEDLCEMKTQIDLLKHLARALFIEDGELHLNPSCPGLIDAIENAMVNETFKADLEDSMDQCAEIGATGTDFTNDIAHHLGFFVGGAIHCCPGLKKKIHERFRTRLVRHGD